MRILSKDYSIRVKIWIEKNGKSILGPGRIAILNAIAETSSLTEATKKCQISFRKAWRLINEINENLDQPIIITERGGKVGGGHTYLTEYGKKLLDYYNKILLKLEEVASEPFS